MAPKEVDYGKWKTLLCFVFPLFMYKTKKKKKKEEKEKGTNPRAYCTIQKLISKSWCQILQFKSPNSYPLIKSIYPASWKEKRKKGKKHKEGNKGGRDGGKEGEEGRRKKKNKAPDHRIIPYNTVFSPVYTEIIGKAFFQSFQPW